MKEVDMKWMSSFKKSSGKEWRKEDPHVQEVSFRVVPPAEPKAPKRAHGAIFHREVTARAANIVVFQEWYEEQNVDK
jgi:hypothetical protein